MRWISNPHFSPKSVVGEFRRIDWVDRMDLEEDD